MTNIMTVSLSAIHIYPVKALGGISLAEAAVTPRGLKHDRRFLVIDMGDQFVTQREVPKMATVWMEIEGDQLIFSTPDMDALTIAVEPPELPSRIVSVWSSDVLAHGVSVDADTWLSDYLGFAARLVYMPESSERKINPQFARTDNEVVSFADGYPLLVIAEASLADLNERIVKGGGSALPMNRFRPNLVIRGCEAYAEDKLGEIRVGEATFRAVKPCARCQVTTTDQASGDVHGPEPLQTLGTYRDTPNGVIFGTNLVPVKLGSVRAGDAVTLAR
ncbi:MAG: MOSC N-terminal beta barrel domain-containing protein [Betaproteobacteria bacterium]